MTSKYDAARTDMLFICLQMQKENSHEDQCAILQGWADGMAEFMSEVKAWRGPSSRNRIYLVSKGENDERNSTPTEPCVVRAASDV